MATVAQPSSCPTCRCALHAALRTWEVRCFVCRELRWPYQVEAPGPFWTCRRCETVAPEKREIRVAAARLGVAARREKGAVAS